MSSQKTYKEIFNEMADKNVNFGEYNRQYSVACTKLGLVDQFSWKTNR